MKKWRERLLVFFFSLFCVLIVLEIGLRIGSALTRSRYPQPGSLDNSSALSGNKQKIIFCLGDSFTRGVGVPPEKNYPSVLENLLNSSRPDKPLRVINLGNPGCNSSFLYCALAYHLRQVHPDLVIIWAGDANFWRLLEYHSFAKRHRLSDVLDDALYRFHLFKMLKYLLFIAAERSSGLVDGRDLVPPSDEPPNYWQQQSKFCLDKLQYEKALHFAKMGVQAKPPDYSCYLQMGIACRNLFQIKEAIWAFRQAAKYLPADSLSYHALGHLYLDLREMDEALRWFTKGLRANPEDFSFCLEIAQVFQAQGKTREGAQYFEKLSWKYPMARDFYLEIREQGYHYEALTENPGIRDQKIREWIASDIEKMILLCKLNHSRVMLLSYPRLLSFPHLKIRCLEKIARKENVPFVDNYHLFGEFWRRGEPTAKYILPDSHCNELGNRIIAEHVYKIIVKENLLD